MLIKKDRYWPIRLLMRVLKGRATLFMIATSSLILACSLATALIGVSRGVAEKFQEELKAYGANIMIQPKKIRLKLEIASLKLGWIVEESYLSTYEVTSILSEYKGLVAAYILYLPGEAYAQANTQISVMGGEFQQLRNLTPWWRIEGSWPQRANEGLIGKELAKRISISLGDHIILAHKGKRLQVEIIGIVETGAWEDKVLFIDLAQAQELFSLPGKIGIAFVRANTSKYPVSMVAQILKKELPGATVKTIRQVANSEESLLSKVRLLMILAILVALFSTFICTMSTIAASLLERRRDIGLFQTLGASRKDIYRLFLTEALVMGLLGGTAGYATGTLLIQLMAKSVWGIFVPGQLHLILFSLIMGITVAGLASLWPIKNALREGPASCLRGG